MSTVVLQDGFEVKIYTRDHPPPHVHVVKADEQIIINLGSETEPLTVRKVWMSRAEARRAIAVVEEHRLFLLQKWRDIYG